MHRLTLSLLPDRYAICRLASTLPLPELPNPCRFLSVSRTEDELSLVVPESEIPANGIADGGWRCFKLHGPFPFEQVGVLASLAGPLARAEIGIFVISTFDTDYLLVKEADLDAARKTLGDAGHEISP